MVAVRVEARVVMLRISDRRCFWWGVKSVYGSGDEVEGIVMFLSSVTRNW